MPHTLLVNEKEPDCGCLLVQEIRSKRTSLLNGGGGRSFYCLICFFLKT